MSHAFKTIVRPAYDRIRKTWERVMLMSKGLNPIVLQGIQRSGTNFLSEVLMAGNYRVLNQVDPPRDDPRHKHFRWFADKDLIAMDYRYCNSVTATTIGEVNATAGWPEGTRHLVLFRDPEDWLHAIFRWGVDNEWFASEAEFIETGKHRAFMAEWHAFYGHWHRLAAADPDHVLILRYQDLKTEPAEVLARVDRFAGVARQTPIDPAVSIRKVRHSKPLDAPRQNLTSAQSLEAAAMEGAFDWRRCLSAR